jgi:hypothetical protein
LQEELDYISSACFWGERTVFALPNFYCRIYEGSDFQNKIDVSQAGLEKEAV